MINLKKKSKVIQLLTGFLTMCITFGASCIGVYSVADVSTSEYVTIDFSGVSITGQGPVGVDIVRTNEPEVTFEYLNMDHPENCVTSAEVVNGIMQITVTHSSPDGINVDFGAEPRNIVRIYVPDAVYSQFDITSEQMVLHMQDFNAPVHVISKQAGFSLIDANISRGVYDIEVTSGPLYIEADTILKDIAANVDNGPLTVCFNEEPTNLYLDTTNLGPGWIERPANWPAIYQVGNGTPKVILSNYGSATIKVANR